MVSGVMVSGVMVIGVVVSGVVMVSRVVMVSGDDGEWGGLGGFFLTVFISRLNDK